MRKQDIKSGVVYAYRERKYGPTRPVVFLGTDPYTRQMRGTNGPKFRKAVPPAKVGQAYGPPVGYPAVRATSGYRHREPDWGEISQDMARFTLADFEAAADDAIGTGIEFGVIDRLACVLGAWDDVAAADRARRQAEQERLDREQAAADRSHQRADAILSALAVADVKADRNRDNYGQEVTRITLSLDEAEKLARLLNPEAGE